MKVWCIPLLALAWAALAPARAAVPAACASERAPVQRLFCGQPALRAMDHTVRLLSAAGGDAAQARRDQQRWQAHRNDVLWTALANPMVPREQVLREAWRLERSRQAFLLGRAGQGGELAAPLARMAEALRKHPPGRNDPLADWAAHDAQVTPAREWRGLEGSVSDVFARAGLHPDLALRLKVGEMADGQPSVDLMWLPSAGLGAVVAVQGSASCRTLTWFRSARGGVAHPTPAPMLDQLPCAHARLTLLKVGYETYVALEQAGDVDAIDVSVQAWQGERWSRPERMRLRFDHALELTQLRCTGGDCARFVPAVRHLAARYDRDPQGARLALPRIGAGERARADGLLKRAMDQRDTTLARVPLAVDEPLRDLCREASVFVVRVQGRLLLGRIGHGRLGWRRADGWRVGLWDMRNGKLVPVAGAVIRRPRGALLAVAPMPDEALAAR